MKNQLKTILLLGVLSALLIAVGGIINSGSLWLFATSAALLNVLACFYSGRVVLAANRARPVTTGEAPELHRIVADVAGRARVPKPQVYLVEDDAPNAFATGRNPAHGVVAVTTGLLRTLSGREIRGVIAHEMAHIKNRDVLLASITATVATIITLGRVDGALGLHLRQPGRPAE